MSTSQTWDTAYAFARESLNFSPEEVWKYADWFEQHN